MTIHHCAIEVSKERLSKWNADGTRLLREREPLPPTRPGRRAHE
jgi:hypothetical protein